MFLPNFRSGLKSLRRHRTHSVLNVLGFSFALTAVILIGIYCFRELTINNFHKNSENIYKICSWGAPYPMAGAIGAGVPEIEAITNVYRSSHRYGVKWGEDKEVALEKGIMIVDPDFFKIFTFPIIAGDPVNPLPDVQSVALTQTVSDALFNKANPIGESVVYRGNSYVVTAILKDSPLNSSMQFSAVFRAIPNTYWKGGGHEVFSKVKPDCDIEQLNLKMQEVVAKSGGKMDIALDRITAFPFSGLYFNKAEYWSDFDGGNWAKVMAMLCVGVIILLLAIINFFNLSTASGMMRAKEIGLRKVNGATRFALITQFQVESIAITFIAMLIALILVNLIIPVFGMFVGVPYPMILLTSWWEWLLLIGGSVFIGGIAGSYPAFYLSRVDPINALYTGRVRTGFGVVAFRKVLIVFQLTATIAILACTYVIAGQLYHMRNVDMGFDKEPIIMVAMDSDIKKHRQAFTSDLMAIPGVENMTSTSALIGYKADQCLKLPAQYRGEEKSIWIDIMYIDTAFLATLDIDMVQGRMVELPQESGDVLLNEAAVRELNVDVPTELVFHDERLNEDGSFKTWRVRGVCKDFHYTPMTAGVRPLMLYVVNDNPGAMMVNLRINKAALKDYDNIMDKIETLYNQYSPVRLHPEVETVNSILNISYIEEIRFQIIFGVFSLFTIVISCFGLFGLILFSNARRRKEIGVRKVYGSTISEVVMLLIRGYLIYVAIAFVIATPVAYYFMHEWLEQYPYRVGLHWWFFVGAGLTALVVVAATVGLHSWRTARANPVKSIQAE